jgi:hypothetical protein
MKIAQIVALPYLRIGSKIFSPSPHTLDLADGGLSDFLQFSVFWALLTRNVLEIEKKLKYETFF